MGRKELDSSIRNHFIRSSQGSGAKVPPKTWQGVISAIKKLRPDHLSEIDRLLSIKKISRFTLRGAAADIILQEREALGIALDIFDSLEIYKCKYVIQTYTYTTYGLLLRLVNLLCLWDKTSGLKSNLFEV